MGGMEGRGGTVNSLETKREERQADQRARSRNFPKDRICFFPSETAARSDVAVFNKYIEYKITKAQAMKEIAANNYLAEITEEQFINELILLGWYVPQRKGKDK